ncbi:MAG: branched-chain amino acid transport system ATP-binding protein [Frankiaceae bacterium]|jgi:sulfate-transporting ATPase|nr:branched-chain amino acid transport system ATP-binding protein [Frankiaceae bacterium]
MTLASGVAGLPSKVAIDALLAMPLMAVYLLYATGIVVIYRASRVLNLAHGAMAAVPAYFFYSLTKHSVPAVIAVLLSVAGGALFGVVVNAFVVQRLRPQGPTAQTVGTVAVFALTVALLAKMYGTAPLIPARLFPDGVVPLGHTGLPYAQIVVFVIGAVMVAAMFAMFRFSGIGLAMRASADNRRGARLMGIDVERTTTIAWALGGGLAGLAGVLVGTTTNIHPYTLPLQVLPAFVAVLIGGMESLPGAIVGAAVVGLVQGEVPAMSSVPGLSSLTDSVGFPQLVLLIVTFVVMIRRGARLTGSQVRGEATIAASAKPATRRSAKPRSRKGAAVVALAIVVFPFLPLPYSILADATLACFFLVAALSVVLLTGWVGQISLAQAEFIGVGAFFTALLSNRFDIGFPLNLPIAMAVAAAAAAGLGVVALRVRGLYLAVATLVFAWTADTWLFNQSWIGVDGGSASVRLHPLGNRHYLPYFDFNNITLVFLLFAALAGAVVYALANLRESKTGRALFAIRGSELAAASLAINVTRYKLLAFLLSGAIAGAAGNLYMVYYGAITPDAVNFLASLFVLSIAVVGGLQSPGGAIAAAIVFAALQEVFFRVHALGGFLDIVAAALLLVVLLGYPGGVAAIPARLGEISARITGSGVIRDVSARLRVPWSRLAGASDRFSERYERTLAPLRGRFASPGSYVDALDTLGRAGVEPADQPTAPSAAPVGDVVPLWSGYRPSRRPVDETERPSGALLEVRGATVKFGGLTAVDDVSLAVRTGEIVGLIGANGAGKTTCFNVVSGLVQPVAGTVELFGEDVTALDVHERAARGVARTFQDIQLFPQLDVFDNLLVATHHRNGSGVAGHIMVSRRTVAAEYACRERVRTVLDFLGLAHLAHRQIADLSFGLLRLVEVARALVTGSPLILLDEPASGLDNAETDRLAQLLLYIRDELAVSMLVVEHDVRTVVGLSDYLYVLDQGRLIGEGRPLDVQRSRAVQSAYLGEETASEAAG